MVGNITNLSEARYCAGMGVHFLAFPVDIVNPKMYQDITSWIQGPEMVLDISASHGIPDHYNEYKADYILMNVEQLLQINAPISNAIIVKANRLFPFEESNMITHSGKIRYIVAEDLLDDEIQKITNNGYHVLLATTHQNEIDLVDKAFQHQTKGIVLMGSQETRPGLKNYEHLSSVLELLEDTEN